MNAYRIEWYIDIEADTPLESAQLARGMQLDAGSIATIFTVIDRNNNAICIDVENGEEYPSDAGL